MEDYNEKIQIIDNEILTLIQKRLAICGGKKISPTNHLYKELSRANFSYIKRSKLV